MTADDGDMDGAHQLHAKGTVAYREQNNVPMVIRHPAYRRGGQCQAVTSDRDVATTLVSMTGVDKARRDPILHGLPGQGFLGTAGGSGRCPGYAVRPGTLFNYNMFAYLDGDYLLKAVEHIHRGGDPMKLEQAGVVPDMTKRGAVRSVFDGRYVFSRYLSPRQHNPASGLRSSTRCSPSSTPPAASSSGAWSPTSCTSTRS